MEIQIGSCYSNEKIVDKNDTASKYGSGMVEVFATPAMIAFMEQVCMQNALQFLPEGYNTVGTHVNVSHIKASPVGAKITVNTKITEFDGKIITFDVIAFDNYSEIGRGSHKRAIINVAKFMSKINELK